MGETPALALWRSVSGLPPQIVELEFIEAFEPAALSFLNPVPVADTCPGDGRLSNEANAARHFPPVRAESKEKGTVMKYAGLLVMPAGFFLCIAAILLFPDSAPRSAFVLCGLAVEAMGLTVAVRGHMGAKRPHGQTRGVGGEQN